MEIPDDSDDLCIDLVADLLSPKSSEALSEYLCGLSVTFKKLMEQVNKLTTYITKLQAERVKFSNENSRLRDDVGKLQIVIGKAVEVINYGPTPSETIGMLGTAHNHVSNLMHSPENWICLSDLERALKFTENVIKARSILLNQNPYQYQYDDLQDETN